MCTFAFVCTMCSILDQFVPVCISVVSVCACVGRGIRCQQLEVLKLLLQREREGERE